MKSHKNDIGLSPAHNEGPRSSRWKLERIRMFTLVLSLLLLSVLGSYLFSKVRFPSVRGPPSFSSRAISTLSTSNDSFLERSTNDSPKHFETVFLAAQELAEPLLFESGSVTAIIPVTENSFKQIHLHIDPLINDQSSVSAITLVCPSQVIPDIRMLLQGGQLDTFLDINVVLWGEGLDEGSATLNAAALVSTEYALIIGSEGFGNLHEDSRDMLLAHPLLLDVPSGFCGGQLAKSQDQATCALPLTKSRTVSYLFPPFVIPSSTIRGFNSSTSSDSNIWVELGKATLHEDGIGAFIRESDKSSDRAWCYAQCQVFNLIGDDPALAQCETVSNSDHIDDQEKDSAGSSSLAIVLQTIDDLKHFSSAICSFIDNNYNAYVLILSQDLDHTTSHDGSFPWLHDQFISSICDISYSALHSSSNEYANSEAVGFWLQSANESMSVIFYGTGGLDTVSEASLRAVFQKQSLLKSILIEIPRDDMRYCDWIGSLSLVELRNWNSPEVEISVITDSRPSSLARLFTSLRNARYYGDTVSIRINVEQTADLETRKIVNDFVWDHGGMFVHHRVVHGGLLAAVVESWYPRSNHSYGVILEDDVEVSPFFYAWTKLALLRYRYGNPSNKQPNLFGISLYQQNQIELRPEGRRPFNAQSLFDTYGILYRNTPYVSQIPCSWGAVYFPEHWREFHAYLMVRFSEAWLPLRETVVPHVRSNRWTKSWKRFFIELAFLRGYVMLYPNYDDLVSLSTNHLEIGSHVKQQPRSIYDQKKAMFMLPLMPFPEEEGNLDGLRPTGLLELPEDQMPSWYDLPVLDLLGGLSSVFEIEERGRERQKGLVGCTTIGSQLEGYRLFEAEELFTCIATIVEGDAEDDFDSMEIHNDI